MKYFFIFLFTLCFKILSAQGSGEWTWMKGDSTYANDYSDLHSFGVKGVYSDTNIVPKLYGTMSWSKGNRLYLLGGSVPDLTDYIPEGMNAMWEYNVDSNKWCWIKGEKIYQSLQYPTSEYWGTQGTGDSITFPLWRENSAYCTDNEGNFWLFGGYAENELWKYNLTTNIWTWMKGLIFGLYHHYGIKGVADSLNAPPQGQLGEMWADKQGNLWLYGGKAMSNYQWYQTVWRYTIATNQWTWMSGDTLPLTPGPIYNSLGSFDATNTPGGRENNHLHWVDSLGNLYLFGGFTYYPFGFNDDLWKYDISLNQWACIKADTFGVYISYCAPVNLPAARSEAAGWVDHDGYFWLYGGDTYYTNPIYASSSNDVWKYDPYHNQWWWESGENYYLQPGVYGQQGIYNSSNVCRSRLGCAAWVDSLNHFWVWGGCYKDFYPVLEDNNLNDLWRYIPDSTCGVYTGTAGPAALEQNHFIITPNPATDYITIISIQPRTSIVRIYNEAGMLMLSDEVVSSNNKMDVHILPQGIYIIEVLQGEQQYWQKLVKE